jgi:hypothetical protein
VAQCPRKHDLEQQLGGGAFWLASSEIVFGHISRTGRGPTVKGKSQQNKGSGAECLKKERARLDAEKIISTFK